VVVNSDRSVQCSAVVLVVRLICGKTSIFNLKIMLRIIRRTCLSISQSVASEAIGLFVLCPFQLSGLSRCPIVFEYLPPSFRVIILVISSTAPKGDTDNRLYNVLQAVATCSACLRESFAVWPERDSHN